MKKMPPIFLVQSIRLSVGNCLDIDKSVKTESMQIKKRLNVITYQAHNETNYFVKLIIGLLEERLFPE